MEFHKHYYSTDFRLETDFLFYFQIMFGNTHLDLYLNLKLFTQQCSKHYDSIWICLLFPFHSNFSCSWAVTLNKNRLNSFKSENAIRSTQFAQSKMLVDFFPIVVVGIIYWLFFKKRHFFVAGAEIMIFYLFTTKYQQSFGLSASKWSFFLLFI